MTALILTLLLSAPLATEAISKSCTKSIGVVPDRPVHGKLAIYNGGYPNFRLWEIGTHHLMGIYGGSSDLHCQNKTACFGDYDWTQLPKNVDQAFDVERPMEVSIYGDFVIRPLTKFKAGSMQAACIVSADHLVRRVY